MKTTNIIIGIIAALILSGCSLVNQINTEPFASENTYIPGNPTDSGNTYTPGELTYYVNLPQHECWSLSTYMCSEVQAMVLSGTKLDSLMNNALQQNILENNGAMSLKLFDDADAMEYPLYLYQTYRGMDWAEMAQMKRKAEAGDVDAEAKLQELEQMYSDDFAALTAEDLPEVYPYLLKINTNYNVSNLPERHHSVELKFGRDTVVVPLGTLDITMKPLWENLSEAEEIAQQELDAVQVSYWTDTAELSAVQIEETSRPQVLTGITYLGGEVSLFNISISWTEKGETVTHSWDGSSSFTIPADTQATLSATLYHSGKSIMGYCAGGYLAISREYEGVAQRLWYSLPLMQHWNVYELYAVVVDGIDLTPYYAYAQGYTPVETEQEQPEWEQPLDQVLLDQNGFSITAVRAHTDNFAYTLTVAYKNETEEDAVFYLDFGYVNGYKITRGISNLVPTGEQVETELVIPWENLNNYGIIGESADVISRLDMELTVKGTNDQFLLNSQPALPLYLQGTEVEPELVLDPGMTKLVDTEKYEVWLIGDRIPQGTIFEEYTFGTNQYRSQMLFVNKSDQNLAFWITGADVNGESVPTGYVCFVDAGRFAIGEYIVFSLNNCHWEMVEEIMVSFTVKAADGTWMESPTATYYPHILLS